MKSFILKKREISTCKAFTRYPLCSLSGRSRTYIIGFEIVDLVGAFLLVYMAFLGCSTT